MLRARSLSLAGPGTAATGHRTLALVFGVLVVINRILMYVWGK
jgi:hypothetical protein